MPDPPRDVELLDRLHGVLRDLERHWDACHQVSCITCWYACRIMAAIPAQDRLCGPRPRPDADP